MAVRGAPPRSTASGADRISALPDGVRERVLSFLPAHDAVRTTVLARSWHDLWMRSPALRIVGWGTAAKFTQFVDRLMRLHLGFPESNRLYGNGEPGAAPMPLDSCQFDLSRSDFHDDETNMGADEIGTLMSDWIQRAARCQVRVLRFRFLRRGVPLDVAGPTHLSEHLTKLELAGVAYQGNLDLSGCPALQDMEIEDCFFLSDEIQAPYLKHLTMKSCCFMGHNDHTLIRLQSLTSLKFTECHGAPVLASMPSLATAIVTLDPHNYFSHIDQTSCLLLNGLSEATNLELSTYPQVTVFRRDLKFAKSFNKLKTLVLADWFVAAGLNALIWFLKHSPILEKLTLQITKVHRFKINTEGSRKLPKPSAVSSHLKMVKIECVVVDGVIIEILKILTASGVLLEQISIQQSTAGSGCVKFKCTDFITE